MLCWIRLRSCYNGHLPIVQYLVSQQADACKRTDFWTFWTFILRDFDEFWWFLWRSGFVKWTNSAWSCASWRCRSNLGWRGLIRACQAPCNPSARTPAGATLLHAAAQEGQLEAALASFSACNAPIPFSCPVQARSRQIKTSLRMSPVESVELVESVESVNRWQHVAVLCDLAGPWRWLLSYATCPRWTRTVLRFFVPWHYFPDVIATCWATCCNHSTALRSGSWDSRVATEKNFEWLNFKWKVAGYKQFQHYCGVWVNALLCGQRTHRCMMVPHLCWPQHYRVT